MQPDSILGQSLIEETASTKMADKVERQRFRGPGLANERLVPRRDETELEGGEDGFHLAAEQSGCIEPKTGEDAALENGGGVGGNLVVFAFAEFPPDDALFGGDPGKVLADAVAAVRAFFLVEVVGV